MEKVKAFGGVLEFVVVVVVEMKKELVRVKALLVENEENEKERRKDTFYSWYEM